MQRDFAGVSFDSVATIEPERNERGQVLAFMPQNRYAKAATTPLNPHGQGPFTRFSLGSGDHRAGVYIVTLNSHPVYVGKCADFARRWGPMGYGSISPKNCYVGGQSTNCKVNNKVYLHASAGDQLNVWFRPLDDPGPLERKLVLALRPSWNAQIPG